MFWSIVLARFWLLTAGPIETVGEDATRSEVKRAAKVAGRIFIRFSAIDWSGHRKLKSRIERNSERLRSRQVAETEIIIAHQIRVLP